ncbi:hypothetical protein AB0I67_15140, partial [Nonomuraea sp. NPDC050310]
PVAALRVAGPCPDSLRPRVGPGGAAAIVRGGHTLTGRALAPLDTSAVRRFAVECGLRDFAITATGSPALADHELEAAAVVADAVPGARITLSYEFGRPGLREREAETIRNAALGPAAEELADEVTRQWPGLPVYFARSGEGLVSAHYFHRYPLACRLGWTTSRDRGLTALTPGHEQGTPLLPTVEQDTPGLGRSGLDGGPGVPEPEVAAAYGAVLAWPRAGVERIVRARGKAELDRALQDARDEALTRVVSAGAAPGSARVVVTGVNPLSYLPDGLYRLHVVAEGATP